MDKTSITNEQSFNNDFCSHLEYHLCKTFANSKRDDLKGFWCDGVSSIPTYESQLTRKSVNDSRRIVTKAWIGKDGQTEYEMTIHFGNKSLSRYAKGTSLIDCLPGDETMDWVDIDTKNFSIELKLK